MTPPQGGTSGQQGFALTQTQRRDWLRLWRSENVGPATFRDLLNYAGSAAEAIRLLPDMAHHAGLRRTIRICTAAEAEAELDALDGIGGQLIGLGEPDYPPLLRQIDGAPPLLAVLGNPAVLHRQALAVVGSRSASAAGRKIAANFSAALSAENIVVVSGLARGIDAVAHKSSLIGGTVAVMAGGLNVIYPETNRDLAHQIVSNDGALVTEMPLGWQPRARDFPRRNRLVSGLAAGVLVIEAAERSGTLITARFAGEQGRDVFAVPNSPLDPRGTGTNRLLKQGAIVVTEVRDIPEAMTPTDSLITHLPVDWQEPDDSQVPTPPDASEYELIIGCLGPTAVHFDDIIRFSGCAAPAVHYVLLELSLAGRLRRLTDGRVALDYSEE